MTVHHTLWALSYQFDFGRRLLRTLCWQGGVHGAIEIALFATRAKARAAQRTCCYRPTRVEKVSVTIEVVDAKRRGWKACRYLLVKLVADKDAEINRLEQRLQETDASLHRTRQILVRGEKAVKAAGGE